LRLLKSCRWENTNPHKQQIRFSKDLRTFAPISESFLMYSNEILQTGLEKIYSDANLFTPIKKYLRGQRNLTKKSKITDKDLRVLCGVSLKGGGLLSHYWGNTQWQFPTKKNYKQLQKTGFFKKPYKELRNEYEELRKEYEELRRPFNNFNHYGDVIRIPNFNTAKYEHDTVKPELLTEVLITATTRKNDLILVPFAGSGTECAMAKKHKRNFVGYEIKKEYVEMAINRCKNQNITLF